MNDPRYAHQQWIRHMQDQGWSYGPTLDEDAKKHPRMVPFENLPVDEVTVEINEAAPVEVVPVADVVVEPEREPSEETAPAPAPEEEGVGTDG